MAGAGQGPRAGGRRFETEQELIAALAHRYADPQPEDRKPLDEAYAKAMREVWQRHPDDADIGRSLRRGGSWICGRGTCWTAEGVRSRARTKSSGPSKRP